MELDATRTYREDCEKVADALAGMLADDLEALRGTNWVVTGGTGQLGAASVNLLDALSVRQGLGLTITAASFDEDRFPERFCEDTRGRVAFRYYNAVDGYDLTGADYVIHAAGYGDPRSMMTNPVGILHVNIEGLDLLLEGLRQNGHGRLVYLSSGEAYGQARADLPAFTEDYSGPVDTMETRSCYPTAKRAGESLCRSYFAQYGVEAVVCRQCHAFGPGFGAHDSRVAASFARSAAAGEPIVMKSTGAQVRSWCHELVAASAHIFLAVRGEAGQAYNVAPSETASIAEFAQMLAAAGDTEVTFDVPTDAERAGFTKVERAVLDNAKLRARGWQQPMALADSIDRTVTCVREVL